MFSFCLAEPNDESGANVDAAIMWRERREEFNNIAQRLVRKTLGLPTDWSWNYLVLPNNNINKAKQSKQTTNNNNNNNNNPQSNTKQDPRQEREKKGEREQAKERERELPSLYGNKPNMPRDQQIYILTVNRERDRQQTLGVGECVCEQIIGLNSKCEMRKSFRGRTSNEHILPIPISIFGFER